MFCNRGMLIVWSKLKQHFCVEIELNKYLIYILRKILFN